MLSLFICPTCKVDISNLAPSKNGGLPAHKPDCPHRGAHLDNLTVEVMPGEPFPTSWVASCRDGHSFWRGQWRTGDPGWQLEQATRDLEAHDWFVHQKGLPPVPLADPRELAKIINRAYRNDDRLRRLFADKQAEVTLGYRNDPVTRYSVTLLRNLLVELYPGYSVEQAVDTIAAMKLIAFETERLNQGRDDAQH